MGVQNYLCFLGVNFFLDLAVIWEALKLIMWSDGQWEAETKRMGNGHQTPQRTDGQTDIKTLWLTRPIGPSQWKCEVWLRLGSINFAAYSPNWKNKDRTTGKKRTRETLNLSRVWIFSQNTKKLRGGRGLIQDPQIVMVDPILLMFSFMISLDWFRLPWLAYIALIALIFLDLPDCFRLPGLV